MKAKFYFLMVMNSLLLAFSLVPATSVAAETCETVLSAPATAVTQAPQASKQKATKDPVAILDQFTVRQSQAPLNQVVAKQNQIESALRERLENVIQANAPPANLKLIVENIPSSVQSRFVQRLLERHENNPQAVSQIIAALPHSESLRDISIKFLSKSAMLDIPSDYFSPNEIRELFSPEFVDKALRQKPLTGREPSRFHEFFPSVDPLLERILFNKMRRTSPSRQEAHQLVRSLLDRSQVGRQIPDGEIERYLTTPLRLKANQQPVFSNSQILAMMANGRLKEFFPEVSQKVFEKDPSHVLKLAVRTHLAAGPEDGLDRDWLNLPDTTDESLAQLGFTPVRLPLKLAQQIKNGFTDSDVTATPTQQIRGLTVLGAAGKNGQVISPDLSFRRGAAQAETDMPTLNRAIRESYSDEQTLAQQDPLDQRLFMESYYMNTNGNLIQQIRVEALRAADIETAFTPTRIEIHAIPNAKTLNDSIQFLQHLKATKPQSTAIPILESLITGMRSLLNIDSQSSVMGLLDHGSIPVALKQQMSQILAGYDSLSADQRLQRLGTLRTYWRQARLEGDSKARRYHYLQTDMALSQQAMIESSKALAELPADPVTQIRAAGTLAQEILTHVALDNFLTDEQAASVVKSLHEISQASNLSYERRLELTSELLMNAVDQTVYLIKRRYGVYDERVLRLVSRASKTPVMRFVDSTLRSHNTFLLSQLVDALEVSALQRKQMTHQIDGRDVTVGAQVFNPGQSIGILRINPNAMELTTEEIGVFSEMPTESAPLAGIMTLGTGARLSHLQLLAKALNIPNIKFSREALSLLQPLEGQKVMMSADKSGKVILRRFSEIHSIGSSPSAERGNIQFPVPDFSVVRPTSFNEAGQIAKNIAGPKGLVLSHLRTHPEIADSIPDGFINTFGYFKRYTDSTGISALIDRLAKVNVSNTFLISELSARIRNEIASHPVPAEMMDEFMNELSQLRDRTGHKGGYHVRSDTNIEDLPGFNGAGLNESVPNVPFDTVAMDRAIRVVWQSAFKEKSIFWRALALNAQTVPIAVPSEVIMPTLNALSSGVILSKGTAHYLPGHGVISANWGIGSVVEAGAPVEELTLESGQAIRFAFTSANVKPTMSPGGGLVMKPIVPGLPVLTPGQISELNRKAQIVEQLYGPQPKGYDIEWVVLPSGKVMIVQARPVN